MAGASFLPNLEKLLSTGGGGGPKNLFSDIAKLPNFRENF